MPVKMEEYLKQAPERDKQEAARRAAAEEAEDDYFDVMSALIDAHPIGRPIPHGGCH